MKITVLLSRDENIKHYNTDQVTLDIEEYLKGVVGSEIGNALLEACKAQAVAARTFALSHMGSSGQITDQSSKHQAFRVSRNSSSYANALQAVDETAGQVLYYNGKLCSSCVFSASNGGRIKSSQERWGGTRGYLISKDDPYDTGKGNGHGVGMSQNGAKNMAAQGFNYKQILEFYYPGTELRSNYGEGDVKKMASRPELAVEYAKSKVGCGYVWGASGQVATEAKLQSLHNMHPDHVDLSIVRKWIGKQIFDCASLVRQSMLAAGLTNFYGSGATTQWNTDANWESKGTIDSLPKDKVCCLYRRNTENSSKMQHTGVYLGDGTFIDAAGSKTGVRAPTLLSKYPWTHWAIPKGLYDGAEIEKPEVIKVAYQARVTANSGSTVNMRTEAATSAAVIAKVAIGQIVDVISTVGDWSEIKWNGKSGYMMSKFLVKESGSDSNKAYYVRIECDSEAQAKALASLLAKAKATA